MALRRAAIYGGTFDPVHQGHMETARSVLELFELDRVIFVPAFVPPHKPAARIVSPFHRFAMLALATRDEARFCISTIEVDSPDRPFALQTVTRFKTEIGERYQLFFMMGADSWLEITTWHEWQKLLTACDHIVVTRPGYDLSVHALAPEFDRVVDTRGLDKRAVAELLDSDQAPRTFFTDAAMMDISATAIRKAAHAGDQGKLREVVPPLVADYIEKYGLYTNHESEA